jgi:hypothetical protein
MSFDLSTEPPIRLEEIALHAKAHFSTIYRWVLKGVPGPDGKRVKLEALRVGGRWVSSWAALQRFAERTTPQLDGEPAKTPRSTSRRERAAAAAGKQLDKVRI